MLAVQLSLCSSSGGAVVTIHCFEFVLGVISPGLRDAVACGLACRKVDVFDCLWAGPAIPTIDDEAAWLDGLRPTVSGCHVDHSDGDLCVVVRRCPTCA